MSRFRSSQKIYLTILVFAGSLVGCLTIEDDLLDPNSPLSQTLGVQLIQNSLKDMKIQICGWGKYSSQNVPLNISVHVRKMENGYTPDYSGGLAETNEGEFLGSYSSDSSGDVEIILLSGLGTYRFDFYENQIPFSILIHTQIVKIHSFKQNLETLVVSEYPNNQFIFEYSKIKISKLLPL